MIQKPVAPPSLSLFGWKLRHGFQFGILMVTLAIGIQFHLYVAE